MFRKSLILLLSALCAAPCVFCQNDSISHPHAFDARQLIVPGVLITAGAAGLFQPVMSWRETVRDKVRDVNESPLPADNYVQYVPAAGVLLTNLLMPDNKYDIQDRVALLGTSYALMGIMVNTLKYTVVSPRPDIYDEYVYYGNPRQLSAKTNPKSFNSFPSGHTATAFMGAELARLEYGEDYPLIAVGAYALAAGTGFLRVWNERHWFTDVLAGAGLGILSARMAWWLLPFERKAMDRLFKKDVALYPRADSHEAELALSFSF